MTATMEVYQAHGLQTPSAQDPGLERRSPANGLLMAYFVTIVVLAIPLAVVPVLAGIWSIFLSLPSLVQ